MKYYTKKNDSRQRDEYVITDIVAFSLAIRSSLFLLYQLSKFDEFVSCYQTNKYLGDGNCRV